MAESKSAALKREQGLKPTITTSPLTDKEQVIVNRVYEQVRHMIDLRNLNYKQFNDRNLKQYIDDSEKRLNSYVPTRESQDKEDWQANVALPTVRDKLKRIIAGYSLDVPSLEVEASRATGEIDVASIDRGEIGKQLIHSSYLENENPVIANFWESWEASAKGTIIKYEGYLKSRVKQKFIKSYDFESGEIDFDEREVDVEDKLVSHIVPLTELYISDYYVYDIQEQDELAWIKYYSQERFERDFGRYKNYDKVRLAGGLKEDTSTFYKQDHWGKADRAGKEKIEVIRYYNKLRDEYIIIANGIILLNAPLLWKYNGKKKYPFAKSILEPFAGHEFFYGKSFADIMMGQYDLLNTFFNSIMDKGAKALDPPTLIGGANRDMFDLEDEFLMTKSRIYIDDINQVKPMPIEQVSQADVAMIELLGRGIEDAVPSMPHLMQNKEATAREVVITQERMQEMKSIYNETLVDLWRQKYELRLANIMTMYPVPKKVHIDGKDKKVYRTFIVKNVVLDEDTKERGILAVQFRKLSEEEEIEAEQQASAERMAMKQKGINYRKKILNPEFFNSFLYKITVSPESLHRKSQAMEQASIIEELQVMTQMFPEIFMANQREYFEDLAKAYRRDPQAALGRLEEMQAAAQQQEGGGQEGEIPGGEITPQEGLQGTMTESL